ncbi:hypothetical protein BC936DRAFT_142220 [Jimgerdemannia flammicorona]|uniref:CAAX prenyl protease 2/Lysostaphin resistance protein A-like domain-containing protein n=1 Tax=Jimgerdemannia flammicorona TaxID=994334 RepID=A0A433A0P9_9FUNG|nr:hypothetical protein BC936DRAFT_142220 [Jimgerdemannia flammicorona]
MLFYDTRQLPWWKLLCFYLLCLIAIVVMLLLEQIPLIQRAFVQLHYQWAYGLLIIGPWNWITVLAPVLYWGNLRPSDVGLKHQRILTGLFGIFIIFTIAQLIELCIVARMGPVIINRDWLAAPWYSIVLDYVHYYLAVGLFEEFFFRGFTLSQLYLLLVRIPSRGHHPSTSFANSSSILPTLRAYPPANPEDPENPENPETPENPENPENPEDDTHWLRLSCAVLLNAVIFALYHLPTDLSNYGTEDPLGFIGRLFFGVMASAVYIMTDNLFLAAGMHCVFDALGLSETHIFPGLDALDGWILFEVPGIGLVVACVWCVVARAVEDRRERKRARRLGGVEIKIVEEELGLEPV